MIDYIRKLRNQTHLFMENYYTDYDTYLDKHILVIKYIISEILRYKSIIIPFLEISTQDKNRILELP